MSYIRPNYNAADATWQGVTTYTRPAYNAADAAFSSSNNVVTAGEVTVTITSPSGIQKGRVNVEPSQVDVLGLADKSKSLQRSSTATVVVSSPSTAVYEERPGGRIALIAATTYTPPDGGSIQLFSATGNWVLAREPRPTVVANTQLTGASVFAGDALPTTDFTTLLSGSVVTAGDSLPVVEGTASLYGSVVQAVEKSPTLGIATDMNDNFNVDVLFDAPISEIEFQEGGGIGVDAQLPELSFSASITRPLELDTTIEAPTLSARLISRASTGVDTDFDAPTLDAGIYLSTGAGVDTLFTAPEMDAVIMGGQLITTDVVFTAPISSIRIMPINTFELDATFDAPVSEAGFFSDWSMVASVPALSFECSVTAGLSLDVVTPQPVLDALISAGLTLDTFADAPEMAAELIPSGFSMDATFPVLSAECVIEGGRAIVLDTLLPELSAQIEFTKGNVFSMQAMMPVWGSSMLLGTGGFSVDASFPVWTFLGGQASGISVDAKLPVLTSSVRIVLNNANSEDFL